jgi:hypothetical protein
MLDYDAIMEVAEEYALHTVNLMYPHPQEVARKEREFKRIRWERYMLMVTPPRRRCRCCCCNCGKN